MTLCIGKRGNTDQPGLPTPTRVELTLTMPPTEIVSISMIVESMTADMLHLITIRNKKLLIKMDILLNGDRVDASAH